MVHEVCYGITDNVNSDSEHVNNGGESNVNHQHQHDDSIELWFCDQCKSSTHQSKIFCELCPNTNVGPLKETETDNWVHMVCALYTPFVQFHYTDTMSSITLAELDYHHWGAKSCELCQDKTKSLIGYTVKCSHSHCRKFFHVTW